ncbi:MAG: malate/lactate dehydrogenase [Planctomycetota bacterium]|nr:malate/lactate dehydrogenase [Planctomycetota bacterium]
MRRVKTKSTPRLRLDALRRFAAMLIAASGARPERAAALATHLLWFEAAGAPDHGIARLPDLLDQIARGQIDPKAEGKVGPERAATAVLDGHNGVPESILARAAAIASEKAREYGSGLVRVKGIGAAGPAAPIVADIAIGPMIAMALGPDGAWSVALPAPEGPPLLADSALGSDHEALAGLVPWTPLTAHGEWIVQALSVIALEPLAGFHERVTEAAKAASNSVLRPEMLEAVRRDAREHGVELSEATQSSLREWARRLGVEDVF